MQLDEALVILSTLDTATRRSTLHDFPNLVSQPFLDHVDKELTRVGWSDSLVWPSVPEIVTGVFQESLGVWRERLDAVRSDLFVVADEIAASNGGVQQTAANEPSRSGGAQRVQPTAPGSGQPSSAVRGPTEQEIVDDFVEWDRQQYEHQVQDREYYRLRDDETAYDSYQSYDSYSYDNSSYDYE